jgi:hypothetical protein
LAFEPDDPRGGGLELDEIPNPERALRRLGQAAGRAGFLWAAMTYQPTSPQAGDVNHLESLCQT